MKMKIENEQYHVYSKDFGRVLSTRNKWDAHTEAKFYSIIHGKSWINMTRGFVGNTTLATIANFENGKILKSPPFDQDYEDNMRLAEQQTIIEP